MLKCMNFKRKNKYWCIGSMALLAASLAVPYWLYQQGSPVLMEEIFIFILFILASVAFAMWTWGLGRFVGLSFMCLGVAMLVALHIFGLTFSNRLLIIPLVFILLGFVIHVWVQKKESKY